MSSSAAMPSRAVLGLTAAVLAAHLWLLQRSPPRLHPGSPARAPAFSTRSIAPPAPRVAAPAAAPVADLPAPRGAVRPAPTLPARPPATGPAGAAIAPAAPSRDPPAAAPAHAAAPAAAVSLRIPASMHLRYQVTAQVRQQASQGTGELTWHHDGSSYEARLEVALASSRPRVLHSAGHLGGEGLEPARFGDRHRGEQAAHFDREAQRVVFSNNRPATPLAPGAQDRLSVLLQLAALVAGAPHRFPAGATVVIQTATTSEAGDWVFTVDGEEPLRLPGGELAALKLTRPPRGEFDQRLEVWLAPGEAYAPVRLRLTQPNGDWVDHQWSATDRR